MILFLLAACSTDELAEYAGCTVTTAATDHEEGDNSTLVETYDDQGRVVGSRLERSWVVETGTNTYEGDCLVEEVLVTEEESSTSVVTTVRTCDAHGHPERVDRTYASDPSDSGERSFGYTYTNTHDGEGRLVGLEIVEDGESELESWTYEWAEPCTDPVLTRSMDARGIDQENSISCRSDGQSGSGKYVYFSELSEDTILQFARTFDPVGRMLTEVWDTEGADMPATGTFTKVWDDALAPGPTHETLHLEADERLATTWIYEYACGG